VTTWSAELGSGPAFWLEPAASLPAAETVLARIREGGHSKVVALVGYHDDTEAGAIARRLPYGHRGEGIEEIVFCRTGPPTGEVVQFEDDAWPGEDRTYVADDLDRAFSLVLGFAVEYDAASSVVLVTGGAEFLVAVTELAQRG
jgi:hypothetical protein